MKLTNKYEVEYFDKIDSTISEIKRRITEKNIKDKIIISDVQTAGYGRNNRKWESEIVGNLYMSFCLSEVSNFEINFVPLILALSVQNAISEEKCKIKWPNDILISEKKVAGIIIEKIKNITIVGIGINILGNPINNIKSTNMQDHNLFQNKEELIQIIIRNIFPLIELINKDNSKKIVDEYLKKVLYLNERIIVNTIQKKILGIFKGINQDGSLSLETNKVSIKITSGDIYKIGY